MKNKGIVFGAFDLLHIGHISLFRAAKQKCNFLIVGLHVDPSVERKDKNKPVETLLERTIKLKSIEYVDQVIPYETEGDILNILKLLKPDVRFLGMDYALGTKEISYEKEVEIEFIDTVDIHTTDMRRRINDNK